MSASRLHLPSTPTPTLQLRLWRISWLLVVLTLVIAGVGLLTLYSVAGGSAAPWMDKQAVRLVAGLAIMLALALVPLDVWISIAWPAYAAALALLVGVMLIGTSAMGAKRWLQFGPLSLQPSEIARVTLILALARYYQWLPPHRVSHPLWVALPLVAVAGPAILIMRQPDLGSGLLLIVVGMGLMLMAGTSLYYVLGGSVLAIIAAPLLWTRLRPYQQRRITTFLDPSQDPLGAGYHIQQSKIALGSGGWSGKGYLNGTQGALNFLPEKHTDFVFTAFGEEMGFVGCIILLGFYALLLTWLAVMSLRCHSQFSRLIIGGAGFSMFVSIFVNIGMVTGVLPVVGVPLPLMSYGGTSLISTFVLFGMAQAAYTNRALPMRSTSIPFGSN